jgi:hypothetical protein
VLKPTLRVGSEFAPITLAPDPDYPGFESLGLQAGSMAERQTKAEYDAMVRDANRRRIPQNDGAYVSPYDQSDTPPAAGTKATQPPASSSTSADRPPVFVPQPIEKAAMQAVCVDGQCVWQPASQTTKSVQQTYQRRFRLLPRRR